MATVEQRGADAALPGPGETFAGKYRVVEKLAEGGMGVVFEAFHLQLEEPVAIKFLRPDTRRSGDSGESVQRFLREARAAIKIRSEHVVRVFDIGALESGIPYIVMERLHGRDLERVVSEAGPLPIDAAVDYVLQACEAIAEAHALGIVHRDLKPANLFVTRRADDSPCIKVLDFGVSKFLEVESERLRTGITTTQSVIGSPRYMSPEQMRSSRDVDVRADVWALGIILFEIMTGKPPFDGATMTQVCASIFTDEPAPLTKLRPEAPAALGAVVAKCLQKDAAARYANVGEVAIALRDFGSAEAAHSAMRIIRVLRGSRVSMVDLEGLIGPSRSQPSLDLAAGVTASGKNGALPVSTGTTANTTGVASSAITSATDASIAQTAERSSRWRGRGPMVALLVVAVCSVVSLASVLAFSGRPVSSATTPTTPVASTSTTAALAPAALAGEPASGPLANESRSEAEPSASAEASPSAPSRATPRTSGSTRAPTHSVGTRRPAPSHPAGMWDQRK